MLAVMMNEYNSRKHESGGRMPPWRRKRPANRRLRLLHKFGSDRWEKEMLHKDAKPEGYLGEWAQE